MDERIITTRQVLQIVIDVLTKLEKKDPTKEFPSTTFTGKKVKISIGDALYNIKHLYDWCYKPFNLQTLEKVCHCRDCIYYKKYKKKGSLNTFKMLCSLDKVHRTSDWYCPKGREREDEDDAESASSQK